MLEHAGGSGRPDAASRSVHFGRMPVARKRPSTLPFGATPVRSNTKMSCIVITSPSMPVISVIAVTRRVPSDSRAIWTMRLTAEAICWRTARSGMLQVGHRHHRVEAVERVARAVGVDGRQAAVVAGVHGLQHVERLVAADLADDDAIGPHAQGVDDELALPDRALALDVGRPRLEPDDVPLPQHQLGGVLDGDDRARCRR